MTHVTELETEASRPLTPVAPRANGRVRTSRYRVLGEGSTLTLSILSIACMLGLWWLATNMGWIRPLFLPKPQAIWSAFQQAVAGDLDNHTL